MSKFSLPGTPGYKSSKTKWAIPTPPHQHSGGGVTGFITHLAGDVKNAVYGLPTGAIQLVTHPVKTLKLTGKMMWQTWSPLFHGHPGQFAHDFYDHPLAPILDIATVFTLGVGGTVKGASLLGKAGVESGRISRVAKLGEARTVKVADRHEGRTAQEYDFTRRPARRLMQEANWKLMQRLEPHLPQLVSSKMYGPQARFERLHRIDSMHRAAAKNLWIGMALKAGESLSDPAIAPKMLREISIKQYMNFVRHGKRINPMDSGVLKHDKNGNVVGLTSRHYLFVKDLRAETHDSIVKLDEQIAKHEEKLAKHQTHLDAGKTISKQLSSARAARTKLLKENASQESINDASRVVANLQRQRYTVERQGVYLKETQKKIRKANKKRDELIAKLDRQRKEFFNVDEVKGKKGEPPKYTREQVFEKRVTDLNWAMTKNPAHAARNSEGHYIVVPKHDMYNLGKEAGESVAFLRWFWRKPSSAWKVAQVGYSPRTITQNAVGNYTIFALRESGQGAFMGLVEAVRHLKGDREAAKLAAVGVGKSDKAWIYKHFGDELGNVFGHEVDKGIGGIKSSTRQKLRSGFYPIVHRTADEPVRLAGIMSYLRANSTVKQLMADKGYSFDRAARVAMKRDPNLRRRAAQHTRTISGDYFTKGPVGRILSDVVPFYLWDKHILKSTGNIVLDTPGRAAIATRIGQEGVDETIKLLGHLPEFMTSVIPGALLPFMKHDKSGGRADVFQTAYLNPFATIGDLTQAAEAIATGGGTRPGAAIGGQLNPFLTAGGEYMFGRDLLTGAEVNRKAGLLHGLFAESARNIGEGIPLIRLAQQLGQPNLTVSPKTGKDLLFARDRRSLISSMLGFPVRDTSLGRAGSLYADEQKRLAKQQGTYTPGQKQNRFLPPPPM